MDTVSLNTSLFSGSQSISTDSPSLSMRSVSFINDTDSSRSSTLLHWNFFLAANYISVVEKCMSSMQTGTQMVKLRGGSKGLVRFFYLDEHKSCIRWRPSRKNEKAKISIDSIREVSEGKQSEIFQRYADGSFDPNCCFSIYYGEHMESLDLVSGTGEEARTWITGLKYLMAGISDEDSLAKRQRTRDQWLKQTFTEADKNGDGCLSISEVLQLLHKLNVNLPRQKVKQMFKEADTDDNQGTLGFEEFCSFYKMMSTRRDLYLLMLTYSNHKDHLDTDDLKRFLETEQKMTNVSKEHCLEIVAKFEPCPENQTLCVLGIDGFTNYMRSPAGDIFNPEHYEVNQDMTQPLSNYFIASSHNTYLMGDQLMSQSRVDMYAWVLQAGCRCVEVDCWDGQDGEPIVHHGYTLTSKILFKDVIETINKYAFIKTQFPVILSIENHCSVPQQKKMAQYLTEVLGDKLDVFSIPADPSGLLPSPEALKGKILIKGKKLPPNIDENAEEGDVSDEDSADEMEDDCKLMNGDTSMNRKQAENVAKKKLDNLMKESKIRDREDPDSFTIAALPPTGKADKSALKGKAEDSTDTGDEANAGGSKRQGRSFMGSFSKRKKKTSKLRKSSSFEDTDTDPESSSGASKAAVHHSRKKKTMKLSRALSDLVYTKSVGTPDFEAQVGSSGWQVSSMSETKAHQVMQQKTVQFMRFNQRQLSRIYPSPYRVDSSNFNPQPFWSAGCHLVALNYQTEGRVLQLNRAKFYCNGNCGYILKPACMCEGSFNPVAEDPLPGRLKKQLVLKIISGQQLPKPKDSMLGDRGEIIDPFVEVEIIGLPVDCCKEQTRVVDDNGFNPMWEETLVFTLHMPEIALIRFLVWDHDPIGQDFIGQRTIAFNSMIPGYRHVYLEGMEEASIFVHVAVNDITSKVRAVSGIKGLFHRNPKQSSLDSHAAALLNRKSTFGAHLLRRTASAPTKGQPKVKRGFPEISIDTKDCSSEGASEERESEEGPPIHHNGDTASAKSWGHGTNGQLHPDDSKENPEVQSLTPSLNTSCLGSTTEEFQENSPLTSTQSPVNTSPHCPSTTLSSPSTAITTSSNGENLSPVKNNEDIQKSFALTECIGPYSTSDKDSGNSHINSSLSTNYLDIGCNTPPLPDQEDVQNAVSDPNNSEIKTRHTETDAIKETATTQSSQRMQALKGVFDRDIGRSMQTGLRTPVRRTKSEGQMKAVIKTDGPSVVPEVSIDATLNDRLWSKLDPGSHRDSVSSSSSISSNDTVIDLSLPNLSRKSLTCLSAARDYSDNQVPLANRTSQPRSTIVACKVSLVSKSKSNPNLRDGEMCDPEDELQPRPLAAEKDPIRLMQRRHTWSRLYMEGLKQSSTLAASGGSKRSTTPSAKDMDSSSKSKSLGDLTSDDIACNFESKYRSISRSFIVRPSRQLGKTLRKPQNDLTEQLKRLTDVEPLTSNDFAQCRNDSEAGQEEEETPPLRRSSSRSQSRVRYIANRARQAQERQRLQSLTRMSGSPIEERGNPEGACSVAHSPCVSLDLLSQLPPGPPQQSPVSPDNEVFFMLRL
ncbi:1-phosphatidylinositol 4,5-bisphosphate phosphodiesterase eta-2-like isoform X1 [Carassius auratus]|uniref:Phosphoinositide phospholipase C n=1 Tax=Carassius auratus TaxID=7957 RepID=A0A6P6Q2B5_CARAU|nr:1-phosphatidylinositol 4,5-bisphosphate phosphodiesterase eta-2-like isoform X1 [Carassius auratus]XP_026126382.1 1-phosphatidylinositol 4,5-bisphosphate phosphodiesterase eta-2-like isoform X1 [Carassius auratus]XP_026126383.1 1-phosphatidylinositol 4,5-bisphosphate phosphodiesterase eta-2-like isoform X1 [Carassius auratus]XP_026126384.1 1-phosphatidylinositol 4,5-bisphosphate phosphodiesterase eta-2-like isoform X1 [Carassius auratus]